jgi:hypothetical protein
MTKGIHFTNFFKTAFLGALGIYGLYGAYRPEYFQFIDGVNLLFHEAGHVFFGMLGEYVGIWGGTLFQILFPLGIGIAFLKKRDIFSASVMFFWASQNLIPISTYIKDARTQTLPFVGGEIHDWHYILSRANLLGHNILIGHTVWFLSIVLMLTSVGIGVMKEMSTQNQIE